LLENQEWLKDEGKLGKLSELYASDAIKRAQTISQHCPAIGAYSGSNGLLSVRTAVAEFIERRDGYPSHPDLIYLTNGASEGIARMLNAIVAHPGVGVLVPIPQYPLYTGTLAMLNAHAVPYYLNESEEWSLPAAELRRAIRAGREQGIDVRALVIINPGNPTGSVLTRDCLREIVHICAEERLVLLADEVYQDNVYDAGEKPFVSAKEIVCELGLQETLELVSFHSTSKGLLGECGRRGGYLECSGLDKAVMEQLFKVASVSLCSNVLGQLMVGLMVDPPRPGDESYALYEKERNATWMSLKRRAEHLQHVFNTQMRGVSCQPARGAMYLFPKFDFSSKMLEAAASAGKLPDEFYALELLDATGVVSKDRRGEELSSIHFYSPLV
jgi:aspartate/methionine/tyrosine aminotransferase